MITNPHTKIKTNNIFSHYTLRSEKYIYIKTVVTKTARAHNQGTVTIPITKKSIN